MNKWLRNFMQFGYVGPFMEGDGGGSGDGGGDDAAAEAAAAEAVKAAEEAAKKAGKTLTQEQVDEIVKTQKAAAKKSVLKALGFEDEASAKKEIEEYNKWKASQKTESEKQAEAISNAQKAEAVAKAAAQEVQLKLDAIKEGVNPKHVDNFVVLAKAHITDEKPLKKVVEELKEVYPTMFGESDEGDEGARGTGKGGNPPRKPNKGDVTGIGKRLAEARKQQDVKNPYFNT
jgi:hypothetical protein